MTIDAILHLESPKQFIDRLKEGGTVNLQELFDKAIKKIQDENEDIQKRNAEKPWYIRFLNPLINFFSFGCFTLLEKPRTLSVLQEKINAIKNEILSLPEKEQTWRPDYKDILMRVEASKTIQREFKTYLRKRESSAIKIQRKWRAHFRNKLKKSHQTYEAFRANAILQMHSDPLKAAIKFRDTYKPTHYAFTHGQSIINTVNATAINELVKRFKPEYHHPLGFNFRVPGSIPHVKNTSDYFANNPNLNDSTAEISAQVMSVDAYVHSKVYGESAYSWYAQNSNARISTLPDKPILSLVQDHDLVQRFIQKISSISIEYSQKTHIGSLYTILVPRKIQDNPTTAVAYAALAFGYRHINNSIEFLNAHQEDVCAGFTQYRLVMSPLLNSAGVRVYRKNHLSKEENEAFLNRVVIEVDLLYAYYRLNSLKGPIKETELEEVIEILTKHKSQIDRESLTRVIKKSAAFLSVEQATLIRSLITF